MLKYKFKNKNTELQTQNSLALIREQRAGLPQLIWIIVFLILFAGFPKNVFSQTYSCNIQIKNQPNNQIILCAIKEDKFSPIDSTQSVNGIMQFQIPANSAPVIYRLILGQTTYAKVMNEPPQQLDFIFNKENVVLETDFKAPDDSLKVIQSEENKVWFEFLKKEKQLQEELKLAALELDYDRKLGTENSGLITKMQIGIRITRYNQLQKQRDSIISETTKKYPNLFAARLIQMYREPFLDGNLSAQERNEIFKKEYFTQLDFSDEGLMSSSVYTDKVFKYLMSYAQRGLTREQQEQEFMIAVDEIVKSIHGVTSSHPVNNQVYEYILDYLVRGFEKLNLDNLIAYIAENYSGTTCQTDELTTLERKLGAQNMKMGTIVQDFTLNDINGDTVTLSDIVKEKNLILFWASWCPHCEEMLPQIKQWQKQVENPKLEIISISLDTSETAWKNKVFEKGIESWYNLSDLKEWEGKVAIDYNVYATPTLFLVDSELKILAKPVTFGELIKAF